METQKQALTATRPEQFRNIPVSLPVRSFFFQDTGMGIWTQPLGVARICGLIFGSIFSALHQNRANHHVWPGIMNFKEP